MFGNKDAFEDERGGRGRRGRVAPLLTGFIKDKHFYKDYY